MLPPNPYAFPVGGDPEEPGMELRDYFAGQAIVGLVMANAPLAAHFTLVAQEAYQVADAMLAAREKGGA